MQDRDVETEGPEHRSLSAERARLVEVERYWRGLAPPGSLPRRRDLEASGLGAALPFAFTLEEIAPGLARIRVAGQALHDWCAGDPRGVPLSTLFDEAARPGLRVAVEALFARPALVDLAVATPRRAFRTPITGRLLLLPLLDDTGEVTRAVGVFGMDLTVPPGPRRFGVTPGSTRIEAVLPSQRRESALPEPLDIPAPPPILAPVAGPARTRPEPAPRGFAEPRAPWLRLVVSND